MPDDPYIKLALQFFQQTFPQGAYPLDNWRPIRARHPDLWLPIHYLRARMTCKWVGGTFERLEESCR